MRFLLVTYILVFNLSSTYSQVISEVDPYLRNWIESNNVKKLTTRTQNDIHEFNFYRNGRLREHNIYFEPERITRDHIIDTITNSGIAPTSNYLDNYGVWHSEYQLKEVAYEYQYSLNSNSDTIYSRWFSTNDRETIEHKSIQYTRSFNTSGQLTGLTRYTTSHYNEHIPFFDTLNYLEVVIFKEGYVINGWTRKYERKYVDGSEVPVKTQIENFSKNEKFEEVSTFYLEEHNESVKRYLQKYFNCTNLMLCIDRSITRRSFASPRIQINDRELYPGIWAYILESETFERESSNQRVVIDQSDHKESLFHGHFFVAERKIDTLEIGLRIRNYAINDGEMILVEVLQYNGNNQLIEREFRDMEVVFESDATKQSIQWEKRWHKELFGYESGLLGSKTSMIQNKRDLNNYASPESVRYKRLGKEKFFKSKRIDLSRDRTTLKISSFELSRKDPEKEFVFAVEYWK